MNDHPLIEFTWVLHKQPYLGVIHTCTTLVITWHWKCCPWRFSCQLIVQITWGPFYIRAQESTQLKREHLHYLKAQIWSSGFTQGPKLTNSRVRPCCAHAIMLVSKSCQFKNKELFWMEPNFLGNFFGGGGRVVETWTFYFSLPLAVLFYFIVSAHSEETTHWCRTCA